jgi:hypothetical protein
MQLMSNGFEENPYDVCVFNKYREDGEQITIAIHVDDLLVTSASKANIEKFGRYLQSVYPETRTMSGSVIDYIGLTFDFREAGKVSVTMHGVTLTESKKGVFSELTIY